MRKSKKLKTQPAGNKRSSKGTSAYDLYRTLPNEQYARRRQPRNAPVAPVKLGPPRWRKILKRFATVLIVIVLAVGGYLGYKFMRDFGWQNFLSLFNQTKLKGEDVGRVNILLAGDSSDDPGHSGADLTDSIMLVSIDTKQNKAFMLSIPRDLYVNIPGNGYAKINEVYEDGQAEHFSVAGYPAGGMGLLEETVSQKFNVPINYYSLIDYTAFRDAVNAVGGITINIQSDDPRGLYDPSIDYATGGPLVDLSNGPHTLNGEQALDLARARGDAYGAYGFPRADFDRTQHQRQMLLALAAKATSLGVLSNPVKVGSLFDAYGKNVKTDFQLNELRRLNTIMKKIPQSQISSAALEGATFNGQKDVNLVLGENYSGEDVLVPAVGLNDFTQIDAYIAQLETQN